MLHKSVPWFFLLPIWMIGLSCYKIKQIFCWTCDLESCLVYCVFCTFFSWEYDSEKSQTLATFNQMLLGFRKRTQRGRGKGEHAKSNLLSTLPFRATSCLWKSFGVGSSYNGFPFLSRARVTLWLQISNMSMQGGRYLLYFLCVIVLLKSWIYCAALTGLLHALWLLLPVRSFSPWCNNWI